MSVSGSSSQFQKLLLFFLFFSHDKNAGLKLRIQKPRSPEHAEQGSAGSHNSHPPPGKRKLLILPLPVNLPPLIEKQKQQKQAHCQKIGRTGIIPRKGQNRILNIRHRKRKSQNRSSKIGNSRRKTFCPEKHPPKGNAAEGHKCLPQLMHRPDSLRLFLPAKEIPHSMQPSPSHKSPVIPMPEAAGQKGQKQIPPPFHPGNTASSKGNVHIIPKPA